MRTNDNGLLRLIAVFKLIKALTLIVVGVGALRLAHNPDASDVIAQTAAQIGFNPGGRYLDHALAQIANLPPKDFKEVGFGSFVYAALFLTEGVGLWLAKPWAEWFTTILTASLVPLEIYEICHHPSIIKVIVLLINLAILVYLVMRIRKKHLSSK